MKRIFVAVDISEEARQKVSDYMDGLRDEFSNLRVGWDKPEKLHLTLKFLGDTDEKQLQELEKIVEEIAAETASFKLQIADTGIFPKPRVPRILWIAARDEQRNLAKINARLETECEKIGFAPETRKFFPHLTIGRVKQPYESRNLARKHLANGFEPVEFEVSEIVIYESQLQPTGSVYSVVSRHKLK